MKKIGIFLITLLILNIFTIILVQAEEPSDPNLPAAADDVGQIEEGARKAAETAEKLKNLTDREYLAQEWREIFLKNKGVAFLDAFFTKISFVFFIFFAQNYSLSLKLLAVIILWFYFLFLVDKMFRGFSAFSGSTTQLISLAITIIIAHMQIFKRIIDFLDWLIFMKKEWYWNLILAAIEIMVFILIFVLASYISKMGKENREAFKKKLKDTEDEVRRIEAEGLRKAAEKAFDVEDDLISGAADK